MPGAPLIDVEKAAQAMELGERGYRPPQIAAMTGLNAHSVADILAKHGRWGEIADKPVFIKLRSEQNQHLEAAFRAGAAKLLERAFDESKLEKASTYQLVMSSAIAVDKARLLAGESTENVAIHVQIAESADALSAILNQRLIEK